MPIFVNLLLANADLEKGGDLLAVVQLGKNKSLKTGYNFNMK